jgi:hypothetical protein
MYTRGGLHVSYSATITTMCYKIITSGIRKGYASYTGRNNYIAK